MESDKQPKSKSSRFRLILTIGTFTAMVVLIYVLRDQIVDVINNLGRINAWLLLLIIPIQAIEYDFYARFYRSLFATLGEKVSYKSMYRLGLELNFVNHVLPSGGVSGVGYFNMRLRTQGISTAKSTIIQLTKLFLLYASFQPLLVIGVILLAARGHANDIVLVTAASLITALIIGTFIALYIAESRSRVRSFLGAITNILNKLVGFFRRGKPAAINMERALKAFDEMHDSYMVLKDRWRQLKMPFVYTMLANVAELATLYVVYLAFGQAVNVGAVILAYAVANFAGLISILPAGIGVYEGLMTAVLAATGIPAEVSIPVTLTYRVVSMFVQLVPGYILYQGSLGKKLKES